MISNTSSGLNIRHRIDQIIYKCAELITQNTEDFFLFGFLMDVPFNVLLDIYQKEMSMFQKYRDILKCSYEFLGLDFIPFLQMAMKKRNMDLVVNKLHQMYGNLFAYSEPQSLLNFLYGRSDESNELYTIFQMCIEMSQFAIDDLKTVMEISKQPSFENVALNLFLMAYNGYKKFSKQDFKSKFKSVVIQHIGVKKYNDISK